jgi:hypothetical protein
MPGADRAEIYFIAAMMVLILIMSFAAVYIFVRQYKKEMREKNARTEQKNASKLNGDRDAA